MRRVLILLRHCESTGPANDAPLTERGFADAEALAPALSGLGADAAYASPYARALQSIEPFAKVSGLRIGIDERLREHTMSLLPTPEWLAHTRRSLEDLDHRLEGGDSLRETQARALAALGDIASANHRLPVVATHGLLLSSVLKHMRPEFGFDDWRAIANPALFRVVFEGTDPVAFRPLGFG
ncbi:MAG: histidine phosphatase family protein [Alphaproteobacteria bacterium]|nr:histidine phosphatase family protein [Alphaproteobacteria bacterium]